MKSPGMSDRSGLDRVTRIRSGLRVRFIPASTVTFSPGFREPVWVRLSSHEEYIGELRRIFQSETIRLLPGHAPSSMTGSFGSATLSWAVTGGFCWAAARAVRKRKTTTCIMLTRIVSPLMRQTPVLFQDAAIHDDEETRGAGALRRGFIGDAILHPDGASADANRGVHDVGNE